MVVNSIIMVLLGNERPNFPANWFKHNKGLIRTILLMFQTEVRVGGGP